MNRRTILGAATAGVTGLFAYSTISEEEDDDVSVIASVEIDEELCDDTDDYTELVDRDEGRIEFQGVVRDVPEGYGIDVATYASVSENAVVLRVTASEQRAPPATSCPGSVKYAGTIEYSNVEIREVMTVHQADGEQNGGGEFETDPP